PTGPLCPNRGGAERMAPRRETLAHTLADFRRQGLLDTEKHQVLIRDAEKLMSIAEGLEDSED
ncbi:MAG: helix-turn-helix domain-containing protein, partial [Chloroflexota bacterium]